MNEISAENLTQLEKRYQTAAFVVLAQIFITVVLIVVAWFVAANVDNSVTSQSLTTLWVAILFIAVISFVLRRILFSWERLKNTTILKGIPGLLHTLQANAILLGTLAQVIAIIGFLAATLGGNKFDMFRAGAISLVVFLVNFPRKSVWKKIVANLENI